MHVTATRRTTSGPHGQRSPHGDAALAATAANIGAVGGLFRLDGVWNSGNGVLGGIALPLETLTVYVLLASLAWLRAPM
jgi:hypothetical protein